MAEHGTRVLLAHSDSRLLSAGSRALYTAGFEVAGLCDNGPDAFRMICELEPDVVVMSAFLMIEDAFGVLDRLTAAPLTSMPAVALVVPADCPEYMKKAEEMGAFAALEMPVLPSDLVAVVEAAQPMDRMIPCFAREEVIRGILDDMTIDRKLKGYEYLVTAIGVACRSHTFFRAMTTVVYPEVARRHETKSALVEKCIRSAIDAAWMRGDLERQYAYFGNTINENRGKPTNSEFIARITEALRLEAM